MNSPGQSPVNSSGSDAVPTPTSSGTVVPETSFSSAASGDSTGDAVNSENHLRLLIDQLLILFNSGKPTLKKSSSWNKFVQDTVEHLKSVLNQSGIEKKLLQSLVKAEVVPPAEVAPPAAADEDPPAKKQCI